MTLKKLVSIYSTWRLGVGQGTVEQMRLAVILLDRWSGKDIPVLELSDELICRFLSDYLAQGRAPRTVNNKRASLLTLWRFANRRHLVGTLPIEVPKIRQPRLLPQAWSFDEFQLIVSAASKLTGTVGPWRLSDWMRALLLTCYCTAPRISAAMGLLTSRVSLASRTAIIFEPKTQHDQLHRLSAQCVSALQTIWDPTRIEVFGDWPFDRKYGWRALNRRLKKCITIASVPDVGRFHAIRRTSATLVYDRDPFAAQQFLGHGSLALTERHYIDPTKLHSRLPSDLLPPLNIA